MHQKSFMNINLLTLPHALNVSYTFMLKNRFTANKKTRLPFQETAFLGNRFPQFYYKFTNCIKCSAHCTLEHIFQNVALQKKHEYMNVHPISLQSSDWF